MARKFLVTLELDAGYFREAQAEGQTTGELKKELKGAIKDELSEYNFDRILENMLVGESMEDVTILCEKGL